VRASTKAKKRRKKRRKGWPLPDTARPYWLPDDTFLHAALEHVHLHAIPQQLRSDPAAAIDIADTLDWLLRPRGDPERVQRRLDAQRITERVAEIAAWMRQRRYPRATEQAWQIVALELGYVADGDPFEVATEGKALNRWVRRNR
jgi:hypothetical protein